MTARPLHTTEPGRAPQDAWHAERAAAAAAREAGDADAEWHHLERAHILSQPLAGRHLRTHAAMLGVASGAATAARSLGQALAPAARRARVAQRALPARQHRRRRCQRLLAHARSRRPPPAPARPGGAA